MMPKAVKSAAARQLNSTIRNLGLVRGTADTQLYKMCPGRLKPDLTSFD